MQYSQTLKDLVDPPDGSLHADSTYIKLAHAGLAAR